LCLPNKGQEDRPGSLAWAGPEALSLLVIPIQIRGDIIGAVVVEATRQKRVFEQWEISLGQVMADQLGIALQNVELYESEYQRRQQAETLREVTYVVSSSLNLHDVLERILDQLGRVVNYDSAAIHLLEGSYRRVIAGRGFPNPEKIIGLTFPANLDYDEPGSVAIFTRQPVIIDNVQELEGFKNAHHQHIKSWLGIPLIARDKVIGLISIDQVEANAFHQGDIELAQAFASQVAVALENARLHELEVNQLEQELRIAQEIQETLLPQLVPQIPGLQISGRLLPAQHIGGDFFHFFSLGENKLGVAIGDVSGKGIPAALYMAVAITAIDINVRHRPAPAELLNQLNDSLYNRLQENRMNIGLQVAVFTPLAGGAEHGGSEARLPAQGAIMTIASAGMIAPIGATVHGCRFLPVSGLPLAALPYPEQHYSDEEFLLDPFTTVIFTSDGVVEARNEAGELFGFERLEATVNKIIGKRDAETIAEHIIHTAQAFIGRAEQNDDMTVVVVVKT
jgi:phosphoserine phosphatase RsbU/P